MANSSGDQFIHQEYPLLTREAAQAMPERTCQAWPGQHHRQWAPVVSEVRAM